MMKGGVIIEINDEDMHCSITSEIMKDPVIAADGKTYEREAILKWLSIKGTSPYTREPISNVVVPDYRMKSIIEQALSQTEYSKRHLELVYRKQKQIDRLTITNSAKNIQNKYKAFRTRKRATAASKIQRSYNRKAQHFDQKWLSLLKHGDAIDALDSHNQWHEAKINDTYFSGPQVIMSVHFISWNSSFDELYVFNRNTRTLRPRIAKIHSITDNWRKNIEIGSKISVRRERDGKYFWYPAIVIDICGEDVTSGCWNQLSAIRIEDWKAIKTITDTKYPDDYTIITVNDFYSEHIKAKEFTDYRSCTLTKIWYTLGELNSLEVPAAYMKDFTLKFGDLIKMLSQEIILATQNASRIIDAQDIGHYVPTIIQAINLLTYNVPVLTEGCTQYIIQIISQIEKSNVHKWNRFAIHEFYTHCDLLNHSVYLFDQVYNILESRLSVDLSLLNVNITSDLFQKLTPVYRRDLPERTLTHAIPGNINGFSYFENAMKSPQYILSCKSINDELFDGRREIIITGHAQTFEEFYSELVQQLEIDQPIKIEMMNDDNSFITLKDIPTIQSGFRAHFNEFFSCYRGRLRISSNSRSQSPVTIKSIAQMNRRERIKLYKTKWARLTRTQKTEWSNKAKKNYVLKWP